LEFPEGEGSDIICLYGNFIICLCGLIGNMVCITVNFNLLAMKRWDVTGVSDNELSSSFRAYGILAMRQYMNWGKCIDSYHSKIFRIKF